MGHSAGAREDILKTVSERLAEIARKEGRPAGAPPEYDLGYYEHQVPGGMVTTLKRQLSEAGKADRLDEVFEEIIKVRKDLGHPIMVTPLSQFVATQATMNIISGERYKLVPEGIIQYIIGYFGEPPSPIDQNVLDRVHGLPKAKELRKQTFPQPSVKALRQEMGIGAGVSDEEFLLRYSLGSDEVEAMLAAGPIRTNYD
jgi:oxaloacetate decarboxylase alpha subunit